MQRIANPSLVYGCVGSNPTASAYASSWLLAKILHNNGRVGQVVSPIDCKSIAFALEVRFLSLPQFKYTDSEHLLNIQLNEAFFLTC